MPWNRKMFGSILFAQESCGTTFLRPVTTSETIFPYSTPFFFRLVCKIVDLNLVFMIVYDPQKTWFIKFCTKSQIWKWLYCKTKTEFFLNLFHVLQRPACKRSCNRLSLLTICTVGVLLALLYYFILNWERCSLSLDPFKAFDIFSDQR